jgi:hypothetical protein
VVEMKLCLKPTFIVCVLAPAVVAHDSRLEGRVLARHDTSLRAHGTELNSDHVYPKLRERARHPSG